MDHRLRFADTGARTDPGGVRALNEDAHLVLPSLLAVADGMGGCADGEVASRVALEALRWEHAEGRTADPEGLAGAIHEADRSVRLGRRLHDDSNMGSTLTCCRLAGDVLLVGHVGDSAAYLLGPEDGIRRLTRDDTPVSGLIEAGLLTADEGRRHPMAHLLTQALGYGPLTPHVDEVRVEPGAVVMVCSDGLSDVVDDADLAGALGADEPEAAAGTLLDLALATGAPDNVTVVVGRVESG